MRHAIRTTTLATVLACTSQLPLAAAPEPDDAALLKELTAQWWQWALSIPAPSSPLTDRGQGAALCSVGQRGPVWFLGGAFGEGGVIERHCSVPQGTTLFFPLANYIFFDSPGICGQVDPVPVDEMRAVAAADIDNVVGLSARYDGKPVKPIVRVRSRVFATILPTDNLFAPFCDPPVPGGLYSPSIDDGYYARVQAAEAGKHTLRFTANNPVSGFSLDVTYHLDVVPVIRK